MAKQRDYHCIICGEYKSNDSFSGKGHASHVCKKCVVLPAAQRSENMTHHKAMESSVADLQAAAGLAQKAAKR